MIIRRFLKILILENDIISKIEIYQRKSLTFIFY